MVKREKISVHQFIRLYPNNEAARRQFEAWRWGDTPRCPHCDSVRVSATPTQRMPWRCKECRKRFSVRVGTVMQESNLSYLIWLTAIYIAVTGLKGTASTKLASDLGITQKSAWHLGQRLRKAWEGGAIPTAFAGPVEVDETYVGGKRKNMPRAKRAALTGRGAVGKTAVVGARDRASGGVAAQVVERAGADDLQGFVRGHAAAGATVYTDEARAYRGMPEFDHEAVNHSVGEYVRGMAHTNGIESFWAMLKRGYHGTHHWWSRKHTDRYVNEFAARHNVRRADTIDQMGAVAAGMVGRRLTYADLTG